LQDSLLLQEDYSHHGLPLHYIHKYVLFIAFLAYRFSGALTFNLKYNFAKKAT